MKKLLLAVAALLLSASAAFAGVTYQYVPGPITVTDTWENFISIQMPSQGGNLCSGTIALRVANGTPSNGGPYQLRRVEGGVVSLTTEYPHNGVDGGVGTDTGSFTLTWPEACSGQTVTWQVRNNTAGTTATTIKEVAITIVY